MVIIWVQPFINNLSIPSITLIIDNNVADWGGDNCERKRIYNSMM